MSDRSSRAEVLGALRDGRALPAGQLARAAGVPATHARAVLAELVHDGALAVERQGPHRYYRIADQTAIDPLAPAPPRRAVAPRVAADLAYARSCYGHLAGRLGVAVTGRLVDSGLLRRRVEANGAACFEVVPRDGDIARRLGLDLDGALRAGRPAAKPCLDWTERRHHVAGALGSALLDRLLALGWLARVPAGRTIRVTDTGRTELVRAVGLDPEVLAPASA